MHLVFIFEVGKIIFRVLIGKKKTTQIFYSVVVKKKKEKPPMNLDVFEGVKEYFFQRFL